MAHRLRGLESSVSTHLNRFLREHPKAAREFSELESAPKANRDETVGKLKRLLGSGFDGEQFAEIALAVLRQRNSPAHANAHDREQFLETAKVGRAFELGNSIRNLANADVESLTDEVLGTLGVGVAALKTMGATERAGVLTLKGVDLHLRDQQSAGGMIPYASVYLLSNGNLHRDFLTNDFKQFVHEEIDRTGRILSQRTERAVTGKDFLGHPEIELKPTQILSRP